MLRVIIEKETLDIMRSTKFAAIFGVCAFLIIASFYIGASTYQMRQAQYEASVAENLRQMEGIQDWFSVEQHRIFLPPRPLESLVSGISNDIGRTVAVQGRGEPVAYGSIFNEEPVFALFRFLDLDFIFKVVLSLFAILLGYNSISGEKERGTLSLSFANALPRHIYIIGKLIGSFLTLAVSLLIAFAIGCLVLLLMGIPMSGEDWIRLVLIIITGMLFFGVFLTASVFVSTLTYRSSNSFLMLLVVWVLMILIIPRVAVLAAGRAVDVPSVDELAAKKASYGSQLWQEFRSEIGDFKPTKQDAESFDRISGEFNRFMNDLTDKREKKLNELVRRLNEDRHNRQVQQALLAFSLARVSPAASLTLATTALAGTEIGLKDRFYDESAEYQRSYGKFMYEKTGMNPGGRVRMLKISSEDGGQPNYIDPQEMPVFNYRTEPMAGSLALASVDMGILLLFNILFFAGAVAAFMKYDLR